VLNVLDPIDVPSSIAFDRSIVMWTLVRQWRANTGAAGRSRRASTLLLNVLVC
jgi:hypothetical protein